MKAAIYISFKDGRARGRRGVVRCSLALHLPPHPCTTLYLPPPSGDTLKWRMTRARAQRYTARLRERVKELAWLLVFPVSNIMGGIRYVMLFRGSITLFPPKHRRECLGQVGLKSLGQEGGRHLPSPPASQRGVP